VACAAELENVPCEDFNANILPECATPGTLEDGAECLYASQCQSRSCAAGKCGDS
jgi:hypothetical protein